MPTDTDDPTANVFNPPKGGLFGGPFDSSGTCGGSEQPLLQVLGCGNLLEK
jgi:hypothetical protein